MIRGTIIRIAVGCAIAALAPFTFADEPGAGGIALPSIDLDSLDAPGEAKPPRPEKPRDDADGLESDQAAFYHAHYRRIADRYASTGGQYWACSTYDARYPSSEHVTPRQWLDRNAETQTVAVGNLRGQVTRKPPKAEAFVAACVMPGFDVGDYGHIHSAKVVEVVGPQEMIVTDIWLVDAEQIKEAREDEMDRVDQILAIQREAERDRLEHLAQAGRLGDDDGDDAFEGDDDRWEREGDDDDDHDGFFDDDREGEDGEHEAEDHDDCAGDVVADPMLTRAKLVQLVDWRFDQRTRLVATQTRLGRSKIRLIGFSTAGVVPGSRWKGGSAPGADGPQIAIVADSTDQIPERQRRLMSLGARQLTAVNAKLYREPMSGEAFAEALAERGVTVAEFCDLARDEMRRESRGAGDRIIAKLEEAGRSRRAAEAQAAAK